MFFLLIRDTPLGKAYVLGTFLTREVTDMGFKVASRVRGLSDEAFREAFGAEEQCRSALSRLRWPDGFVCPACGHRGHCVLAGRSLYQCYRCKKQTSSTAGTIFHATKLPLTLWFAAVHLIVTAKNGISSVELGRRLGVKQPTAWTMKHKIMAVMARREADTPLSGRVEMDDAYLGGARAGGKRGRGAPGKTPFVAAVSTSPEGRPRKVKLVPVKGFRKREIARGAKRWLAPGSEVLTDGLRCWNALDGVVGSHRAIRTGSGRQAALQMGQHDPRQHQERDHRNLPQARPRSCPTLPRQLRLAIQPALPAQHHDPALRSQRRTNPTHPIPGAHRWMTFMDKQDVLWTGCQWSALPKDLPPKSTAHHYFMLWDWDGTLERIHHALYVAVRDREGREASPSAAVIDSQSAKGAQKGGLRSTRRASMRARRSRGASATSSSIHSACC